MIIISLRGCENSQRGGGEVHLYDTAMITDSKGVRTVRGCIT